MFFQKIGKVIESIFDILEKAANSGMVHDLGLLLSATFTIMIMIRGYMALAGKSQDPIREVLWDMIIKLAIVAVAFNYGGYLTMVKNAMEGIHTWAGGGVSLYAEMDHLFEVTRSLASSVFKADTSLVPFSGAIGAVLVFIGAGLGALPALIIIIVTSFTLKILIILAPFMVFALLYGWLKNMFAQFLSLFLSNTLTVLIVTLIFNAIISKLTAFITFAQSKGLNGGLDLIYIGFQTIVAGIIFAVVINLAKEIAEKLASVSIEGVTQSQFGRTYLSGKSAAKGIQNKFKRGK